MLVGTEGAVKPQLSPAKLARLGGIAALMPWRQHRVDLAQYPEC